MSENPLWNRLFRENEHHKCFELSANDRRVEVVLFYPRNEESCNEVEVALSDVRAADSIRIVYDFERDGWSIRQASRFAWRVDDTECDGDWQEVAFVQAWAREESPEAQEARIGDA